MKGKRIPNYALYGESAQPLWSDLLHVEWIRERTPIFRGEIEPHRHDALLQLVYVCRGSGEVSIEHRRQAFAAPCVILLPCGIVHAFSYSAEADGPVITAAQRPLESMARIVCAELLGLLQQPAMIPLPWPADGNEPLWPLVTQLAAEAGSEEPGHVGRAEEPLGPGHELAMAYSNESQLHMLAREQHDDPGLPPDRRVRAGYGARQPHQERRGEGGGEEPGARAPGPCARHHVMGESRSARRPGAPPPRGRRRTRRPRFDARGLRPLRSPGRARSRPPRPHAGRAGRAPCGRSRPCRA